MSKNIIIKNWIDTNLSILSKIYPTMDEDDIIEFLKKEVSSSLVNNKAKIHNNYQNKKTNVDLLKIGDWLEKTKPIISGFGCFYKNQDQEINPAAKMLDDFMSLRNVYKKKMYEYEKGSYDFDFYFGYQLNEKTIANSFYGVSGAPTSNFFNIYNAASTTGTGQSLTATTAWAFEAFMANNIKFINLDDCFFLIENIVDENKQREDTSFLPNIKIKKLADKLCSMFIEYKEVYYDIIVKYLKSLSQNDINRIYFKNNIYEFSYLPKMKTMLTDIFNKVDEFNNPNKVPKAIKEDLEELWEYYKEYVFYNNFYFDRVMRLKNYTRKVVNVIDTDSNMLNLQPWFEFTLYFIIQEDSNLIKRDADNLRFISINTISYIITKMITEVLWNYCKISNIPKKYRPRINMKNEFLFSRLVLSNTKKRYIASIRLQEGKEIFPEKIEKKGLDFIKATTREETEKYLTEICRKRLLHVDKICIPDILRDLEKFEEMIKESLRNGEKSFLIPKSVKETGAYKDPLREQGVRSIIAWNYIEHDNQIQLPEKVDLVKLKVDGLDDLEDLLETNAPIYNLIKRNIYGNKDKKIADKGLQVIAIPRNVKLIPEWIIPYIDYETIVSDNISRFFSILESLGLEIIKNTDNKYFSNILKI